MIRAADVEYYTTMLRDVETRLTRSVEAGFNNDNAFCNLQFELKEDLKTHREALYQTANGDTGPEFTTLLGWIIRLERTRNEKYEEFKHLRRFI